MRKITLLLTFLILLVKANAQLSPLSFYDNFADDSKIEWPNATTGNERTYKESGRYIIDYKQGERGWAVNKLFPKIQWNEVSIELTVNALEGNSPGIGAGFLIGNVSTPGNSYRFVIQPDGTYGFGYFKDNGVKWVVPFTFSKHIAKGNNTDNKLTLKLKDKKALLYINYQLVNTINLPEPVTGEEISLYSGKGQRTAFDNMRVDGYSLIGDPPGKIGEQVNFKLPNVNLLDLYSKKMVDIGNLPKNGKSKVVMLTSQSQKQVELINQFRKLQEMGNVPLDALYIITNDRKPADQKPGFIYSTFYDFVTWENFFSLDMFIYKDKEEKLLNYYKLNNSSIIFFLDAENNIVYAHEAEDVTANQVRGLNTLINNKTITANTTFYFDKNWFPTLKPKAVYYRNKINKEGSFYTLEDFYINGQPQMKGKAVSVYPKNYNGVFKFFDERGIIETERTYLNNQLNGLYKEFYESGKLYYTSNYINDNLNGESFLYYESGQKYNSGLLMKNNLPEGPVKLYYANGNLKASVNYKNGELDGECLGYDLNQHILFRVHYKNGLIDSDRPIGIYDKKGDKIISSFGFYYSATSFSNSVLRRQFKCISPDGNMLEVGEFKEDINAIYKEIFNTPPDDKDLFFAEFKKPGNSKNKELNKIIYNAKSKLVGMEIYNNEGVMLYSFTINNDKLIRGKYFYENGLVCASYPNSDGKGIQIFTDQGKEIILQGAERVSYFSKNLKDNLLLKWANLSVEEIRQNGNDLLKQTFYLPEFLIYEFLQINSNWKY